VPKKILSKLVNADIIFTGFVLAVLILYTFFAVIMRYFIGRPVLWGEEFQLVCIVIIVFLGVGAGFRTKSHVAIDFLVEMFPQKIKKIIIVFVYILSILIILYFFIQGVVFVRQMHSTQRVTDILRIPFFIVYSTFPIGCVSIMVNYTISLYTRYFKPDNAASGEAGK